MEDSMRGNNIIWFPELLSPWQPDAHPYDITAHSVNLAGTECDLRVCEHLQLRVFDP